MPACSLENQTPRGSGKTRFIDNTPLESCIMVSMSQYFQDAQKVCSARPQRVKTGGVPSGAHGATNKEHHVCARRRVSEAAGSPLRIMTNRERSWGPFSASCLEEGHAGVRHCRIILVGDPAVVA